MLKLSPPLLSKLSPVGQTGWIGLDVGTATVKAVQLVRGRNGFRVMAAAIVPRRTPGDADGKSKAKPFSSANELRCAIKIDRGFRGRKVAASLPMYACEVHHLDDPFSVVAHQETTIRRALETLTQRPTQNLQWHCWPSESANDQGGAPRTNVLCAPRSWSDQIYHDLAEGGFSCRLIDGLPHALARAVSMTPGAATSEPQGALDWGFSHATLCVVSNGSPLYVRVLKGCRLKDVLDSVGNSLGVNQHEAHYLMQHHGLRADERAVDTLDTTIRDIIKPHLKRLQQEIDRTIAHLRAQRRGLVPGHLHLFGGGALIQGLAPHLTATVGVETKVWRMRGATATPRYADCLLGPAIALSGLCWEQRQ